MSSAISTASLTEAYYRNGGLIDADPVVAENGFDPRIAWDEICRIAGITGLHLMGGTEELYAYLTELHNPSERKEQ